MPQSAILGHAGASRPLSCGLSMDGSISELEMPLAGRGMAEPLLDQASSLGASGFQGVPSGRRPREGPSEQFNSETIQRQTIRQPVAKESAAISRVIPDSKGELDLPFLTAKHNDMLSTRNRQRLPNDPVFHKQWRMEVDKAEASIRVMCCFFRTLLLCTSDQLLDSQNSLGISSKKRVAWRSSVPKLDTI